MAFSITRADSVYRIPSVQNSVSNQQRGLANSRPCPLNYCPFARTY